MSGILRISVQPPPMAKVASSVTSLLSGKALAQDLIAQGASDTRPVCPADLRVAMQAAGVLGRAGLARGAGSRVQPVSTAAAASGAGYVVSASTAARSPSPVRADLPHLLDQAGLPVPDELLQAHADAMQTLLNCEAQDAHMGAAVVDAAQKLDRLHGAFLAALPAGKAAASSPCQQIVCVLVGDARLINHIHHAGSVPVDREAFMCQLDELPPSRLDRAGPGRLTRGVVS